jgi:hypothetical protein
MALGRDAGSILHAVPGANLVACALFILAALTNLIDGHIAGRADKLPFLQVYGPIADKRGGRMLIALCGTEKCIR